MPSLWKIDTFSIFKNTLPPPIVGRRQTDTRPPQRPRRLGGAQSVVNPLESLATMTVSGQLQDASEALSPSPETFFDEEAHDLLCWGC